MESDHEVLTNVGRVVVAIEPGSMGELMIPVRGGTEVFYAYGADPEESLPKGTRLVVIDHEHPRAPRAEETRAETA